MSTSILIHDAISVLKHTTAVLDYQLDWSTWLGEDNISTSNWSIPTGLTKASDTYSSKTTTVWISGGTDKKSYVISNTIVTAAGRTETKSITVRVSIRGEKD